MAIYSKKQLAEQQEIIAVVRALSAVALLRLADTNGLLEDTKKLLARIEESIARVFEIYPSDPSSAFKQAQFLKKKKPNLITKPLYIFVSSNQELYGDLIISIGNMFVDDLKKGDCDGLVIGKVGRIIMDRAGLSNSVTYFDLDDDKPDLAKINEILAVIEKYAKVVVYHGKNEAMLKQVATKSEVSREIPNIARPQKRYFFEPSPEEVLDFLQTQVSINSFHQKFFEAQVARLNAKRWTWTKQQLARSRLVGMLQLEHRNFRRAIIQKQQQVALSAQRINQDNIIQVR